MSKTLNEYVTECHEIAKSKGFHENKVDIPRCLMLIVSELSEAMEADRKGKSNMLPVFESDLSYGRLTIEDFHPDNENYAWINNRFETSIKDTFEDELADTAIRIFDLCGALNIDLEKHVQLKMQYNKSRPHKHNKAY